MTEPTRLAGPGSSARRSRLLRGVTLVVLPALAGLAACSGGRPQGGPSSTAPTSAPTASRSGPAVADEPASPGSPGSPGSPAEPLARFFGDDLVMRSRGSFNLDKVRLVASGDRCVPTYLRVRYPAGSASQLSVRNEDAPTGGAQVYLLLKSGPTDVLHLSYRIRFPLGFQFNKGGKLPGLFGGDHVAGGNIPDGSNGLSTRYMWRAGGAGEVYAYLPSSQVHGTNIGTGSWSFPPGQWVTMQQRVRLNTPGKADGSITVWMDGRQALRVDNLLFRDSASLQIDGLFFSTFFGGADTTWASPTDQYADFADFQVSSNYINDAMPAGCGAGPAPSGQAASG
ncbi:polysaccharide lyase [Pseudofrankia sp. DC12]|uniref:polysaccharide lyase n=1 Tax=Pseudofrankia sp. DC12 TaxID=683315 RepID=UPI0005F8716D|nr:hypothetical protein [Pseudofrankia sp. DC12]